MNCPSRRSMSFSASPTVAPRAAAGLAQRAGGLDVVDVRPHGGERNLARDPVLEVAVAEHDPAAVDLEPVAVAPVMEEPGHEVAERQLGIPPRPPLRRSQGGVVQEARGQRPKHPRQLP